jgi:poly(A) polymerase
MPALDRAHIDPDADRVVRRLARQGYKAYLVGGCVRDLLLSRKPKDFDVATSATPNEIRALFRNCRIIGRRFRLAHVFFGQKIIETSTFRANPREDEDAGAGDLLIRRDNVFGNETEDARRRDFTINGLFYDVEREKVIDHVDGLADLDARLIRTIGDPDLRFQEDPIRMLRAIKFAARLDFNFEPATYRALLRWRGEIRKCAPPRILEEVFRLLRGGAARRSMELLVETGTLAVLTPHLAALFEGAGAPASSRAPVAIVTPSSSVRRDEYEDYDADEDDDEDDLDDDELDAEEIMWHRTWADEPAVPTGAAPLRISFLREPVELERRRRLAWNVLAQIDGLLAAGRDPSNALALAALLNPFVVDQVVAPGSRPGDANAAIIEIGQTLVDQLRVPRRDAERMRQALLAQRRIVPARRRRGRLEVVAGRDFFDDAVLLFEVTERAAGRDVADLEPLRKGGNGTGGGEGDGEDEELDDDELDVDLASDDDQPKKRRRRRRGGKRRRGETQEAAVG